MSVATKLIAVFGGHVGNAMVCRNCGAEITEYDKSVRHNVNDLEQCKNLCRKEIRLYPKTRGLDVQASRHTAYAEAYEVWSNADGSWIYYVLAKRQVDDHKPYAIWLCACVSPHETDMAGHDTYADDVRSHCVRVK